MESSDSEVQYIINLLSVAVKRITTRLWVFLWNYVMLDCSVCGEYLPEDKFYKEKRTKRGYNSQCKKCMYERRKQNPDFLPKIRKWRGNNPEKVASYNQTWRGNNPEAWAAIQQRFYKSEKGKQKRIRERQQKSGAKGSHTPQQWEARCEYYGNKCVDCGSPDVTKDHRVPLSKGGTDWASNLIPRCKCCNSRKGNRFIG